MEAASVTGAPSRRRSEAVREFISRYGLIAILLILPVVYGIQDLSDDGNLNRLGNNLVEGLSNGAILALIALGYTLVYGIIELINFAHGEVFMLGSLAAAALYTPFGLTPDTSTGGLVLGLTAILILAMLTSASLNVMIERVAYRPLRSAPKLAPLITAVGMSFVLQNVGILWIGASQVAIPDLLGSQKHLFDIWGVTVTRGHLLAVSVTIPLVILLTTFVSQSRLGKAMRATAQDPEAARLMGSTSTRRSR